MLHSRLLQISQGWIHKGEYACNLHKGGSNARRALHKGGSNARLALHKGGSNARRATFCLFLGAAMNGFVSKRIFCV